MGRQILVPLFAIFLVSPVWADEPHPTEPAEDVQVEKALGPDVNLDWWSVDSGGGQSSGGTFSLDATLGQPDAGLISDCGPVLSGGLLAGPVDLGSVFCNGFEDGGFSSWSSAVGGNP